MDGLLSQFVPAYRYGKKTKKRETTPHNFDPDAMNFYIQGMRAGEKYGVPQLDKATMAAIALQEGPTHPFGFNVAGFNFNNKKAVEIRDKMIEDGVDKKAATFAASVFDKNQTAQRLNIPFTLAWNGTGVNAYGQSGRQYASLVEQQKQMLADPKNAPFISWFNSAYDNNFKTPAQGYVSNLSEIEKTIIPDSSSFKEGLKEKLLQKGYVEDAKALEGMNEDDVSAVALNMYRKLAGVAPAKTSQPILDKMNATSKGVMLDINYAKRLNKRLGETTENIMGSPNIVNEINRTVNPDVYVEPTWSENPLYRLRNLF